MSQPAPMSDADVRLCRTMVMAIEKLAGRMGVQSLRGLTAQQLLAAVTSDSADDDLRTLGSVTSNTGNSAATLHGLLNQCLGRKLDDGRYIECLFTTLTATPEWLVLRGPNPTRATQ